MTTGMERLWAPWRSEYFARLNRPGCIFCRARTGRRDRAAHVLYRGRRVFCLLNRYPYNTGHLMVAVNRHVGDLARLTAAEHAELMQTAARMVSVLRRAFKPQGFNVGVNLGAPAGAGIPGHLHMHVVPRWTGDTNFMPVLAHTKVMSLSLDAVYDRLTSSLRGRRR